MAAKKGATEKACPYDRFSSLCCTKWSVVVLRDLFRNEECRFRDFKKSIPNITDKALNETLKRLVSFKLAERRVLDTSPPSTAYRLTIYGRKLLPVFNAIMDWGKSDRK